MVKVKVEMKFTQNGPRTPVGGVSYSSALYLTWALNWDGWLAPRPGRFTPGKGPIPIVQEDGWASGTVWMRAENLAPNRDSIPGPFSP